MTAPTPAPDEFTTDLEQSRRAERLVLLKLIVVLVVVALFVVARQLWLR